MDRKREGPADTVGQTVFDTPKDAYFAGFNEHDMRDIKAIFQLILDLNGTQSDIVAGQPKTYIDPSAYFHYVTPVASDDGKSMSAQAAIVIEQVYNFRALGKGKMGFLGAQLRNALRPYFTKKRESQEIKIKGPGIPADLKADLKEYTELLKRHNTLAAVISKNAKSFAAQAGINLYTKMHHWDSKSQKEWVALAAALGISEEIGNDDLRPLVYLALHPIPLITSSHFRRAAAGVDQTFKVADKVEGLDDADTVISADGFVNSVTIRSRATPAGCASFTVCAAAWNALSSEPYAEKLKTYIKGTGQMDYIEYQELVKEVKDNGEAYHPMAREFGKEYKPLDTSKCNLYMNVAAAYIFETLKGTLARSAALQKYKDQNTRVVNLWQVRFRLEKGAEKDSISAFLTAKELKKETPAARLEAIKSEAVVEEAVNEYVKERVKTIAKAKETLGTGVSFETLLPPSEKGS